MNKRQLTLLLVLLVLAGSAVYMLKDSFASEPIQITCLIRPAKPARQPTTSRREAPSGIPGYNVTFAFDRKVALTSVKVFPLQDVLTNKYPHAIWNLHSASNTMPTKSLIYGGRMRGLQPTVKDDQADPLLPGNSYRLVITTPTETAQRDFQIPP